MTKDDQVAANALDEAKGFWPIHEGETLVPDSIVQLRDVCHALEIILGSIPPKTNEIDADAYITVLEALKNGDLVAKAYASDTTIPKYSWSSILAEDGPHAYDSMFWYGKIHRDEDCHGFKGQLPVLDRSEAENWLRQHLTKRSPMSQAQARREFIQWVETFNYPTKPNVKTREQWGRDRGLSRKAVRDLVSEFAPDYWSRTGANPKSQQ